MKYEKLILGGFVYVLARINSVTQYDDKIHHISKTYGNNWHLVKAIIKVESDFNPLAHNKTDKEDSRGLGQINAPTAYSLGLMNINDLFDPDTNIEYMNKLLIDLKNRYEHTLDIISAYNAGKPLKDSKGVYINSAYVLNVYSRFLAYSLLDV